MLGMDSAYVSAKDVKTIQKMLSGLDAEISQLRIAMESQQANVRRILLDQRDSDSANAEIDREGYP